MATNIKKPKKAKKPQPVSTKRRNVVTDLEKAELMLAHLQEVQKQSADYRKRIRALEEENRGLKFQISAMKEAHQEGLAGIVPILEESTKILQAMRDEFVPALPPTT
jgi:hypothetical protein